MTQAMRHLSIRPFPGFVCYTSLTLNWEENHKVNHDCLAPVAGVLEGQDRQRRQGGDIALCVSDQLECLELCLRMEEEATQSLWVRIEARARTGDIVVVCYRLPDQ